MPGTRRGIWRGDRLISHQQVLDYVQLIGAENPGFQILEVSTSLPALTARISDLSTLRRIRSRPFVDYVEPNLVYPRPAADGSAGMAASSKSGCNYGKAIDPPAQTFAGDEMVEAFVVMGIERAWERSNGSGAIVGFTDTGVAESQPELNANFASGHSSGRWSYYRTVIGGTEYDQCGHGTRMAGIGATPMNGLNTVGAAWGSNLVSIRHADMVYDVKSADAADGIIEASTRPIDPGPRVIGMAWHSTNWLNQVSDAIRAAHDNDDVLFLAASGTSMEWLGLNGVIFPASMKEVIAVSGVDPDTSANGDVHYGPEVELAATIPQASPGQNTGEIRTLGGSSAATAVVTGVAGLVRAEFPNETNEQIRRRLQETAHYYPQRDTIFGYGVIDATAAVGMISYLYVQHTLVSFEECLYADWRVEAIHNRGGNFSYSWSTGATTKEIDIRVQAGESKRVSVTLTDLVDGSQAIDSVLLGGGDSCGPGP